MPDIDDDAGQPSESPGDESLCSREVVREATQFMHVAADIAQRQLATYQEILTTLVQSHYGQIYNAIAAEVESLLAEPGGLDLADAFLHCLPARAAQDLSIANTQI